MSDFTLTERQEKLAKTLFELLYAEGQNLGWQELLMLKSAWQGKLRWEELPDHLRHSFANAALRLIDSANGSQGPGRPAKF